MSNENKNGGGGRIALAAALISTALAFLTLLQSILGLSIPLPDQYKWVIFSVFTIIALILAFTGLQTRTNAQTTTVHNAEHVLPIKSNIAR